MKLPPRSFWVPVVAMTAIAGGYAWFPEVGLMVLVSPLIVVYYVASRLGFAGFVLVCFFLGVVVVAFWKWFYGTG